VLYIEPVPFGTDINRHMPSALDGCNAVDLDKRIPATLMAVTDAVRWAERLMEEIDRRWATRAY